MALTVEDGSIVAGADAYVSVLATDTYNTNYVGDVSWATATEAQKELAIRKATQYLDATYFLMWRGERVNNLQVLQWPREGACYDDGIAIDSDEIPNPLKLATMELAIKANAQTDPLVVDVDAPAANIKRSRVKAGPVEEENEYFGGNTNQKQYTIVSQMVLPLIAGFGEVSRA